MDPVVNPVMARLVEATHALAALQGEAGEIPAPHRDVAGGVEEAATLAARLARACGQPDYAAALERDAQGWIEAGLDTPPDFGASRDALRLPEQNEPFLFWGPLRLANGGRRGYRFECFLCVRDEPPGLAPLHERFPHPKNICQSTHLLDGSAGLKAGNNIVFFPENIRASRPLAAQAYALFFFNKFAAIYRGVTVPTWDAVGDPRALEHSRLDDERDVYEARCVWGYLHDCFHHRGARPFDEQIGLKTKWFTGLLEELKVDLQSLLACLEGGVPHGPAVAEFILFERLLRYPQEPDCHRNFDAGTGLLLFEHLAREGALRVEAGRLRLDRTRLPAAADAFVRRVEAIEALNDATYLEKAQAFVRNHLPESEAGGRFGSPASVLASPFAPFLARGPRLAENAPWAALDPGLSAAVSARLR